MSFKITKIKWFLQHKGQLAGDIDKAPVGG